MRAAISHRMDSAFQSTLPTRGSDAVRGLFHIPNPISIHAPHEGERHGNDIVKDVAVKISIHAPHEGERRKGRMMVVGGGEFQSTLPTRGSDGQRQPI